MAARRPLIHTNGDLKELPDADHADLSIGAAFTPVAAPAHQEGYVFYDTTKNALSYYNEEADITVNMGQETLVRVRNNTGVAITNGQAVYINGSQGANLPTVALAQANTLDPSRAIGIATHDIENNTNGYITSLGTVGDLNTSAFAAGDALYLSPTTPGALTNTKPTTGYIVLLGYCTISHVSAGEIKVIPKQSGLDLLDLQDFNQNSYTGIGGSFMFIDPNETYADVIPPANMYWDVTNERLSINTGVTPLYTTHISGDSLVVNAKTDPSAGVYAATNSGKITLTAANTRAAVGAYNVSEIVHGGFNSTGTSYGSLNYALKSGAGTLTGMTGSNMSLQINAAATGTVTNARGADCQAVNLEAAATITDLRLVNVGITINSGTITNTYGVYVGDITSGTQTNTPYSFYASDAGAWNYFAGRVGVGTNTPASTLHVVNAAGATPSIAATTSAIFQRNVAAANQNVVSIIAGSTAEARLTFGDDSVQQQSFIQGDNANNALSFHTGGIATGRVFIDSAGKVAVGNEAPAYLFESNAEIGFGELSADPANPAEGKTVIWQSDGTGTGSDGDIYLKTTAGASTKTIQLTDHANGMIPTPETQPAAITTATYSTVSTDFAGRVTRRVNHATGCTVTVEPSMTLSEPLTFIQIGAGQITFAAGTGVTISSADGDLKTRVQYSAVTIIPDKDTANLYYLVGDIAA